MRHVALLFPPGSDPRSPYLALPCLAAYLRRCGISVSLHDLDIGGLRFLLGKHLESAIATVQTRRDVARSDADVSRLLAISDVLPARAAAALAVFDDPELFFQPPELNAARATLSDCLDLHSAALDGRVRYSITPVAYDVEGIDPHRLEDLLSGTRDDRWNLFAPYWEESVFPTLDAEAPIAIGITITNRQQVIPGLTLARRLRERGHFVVIGGALFTKFVAQLQRLPAFFETFADAVIAYEGETALVELIGALDAGGDLSRVPNLLYRDAGRVRVNRSHVEDVESLPCPDFDGLPLDGYLTPRHVLPIYLGKGCYFNRCKFCDIPYINHISSKAYRLRSPEKVASDVAELSRRFDCRHFELTDEALPPRTLEHLAHELNRTGRHVNLVGYARLEPAFTAEMCRTLAAAGVRKLFFGLESGAQQTLDHMDKGIDLRHVPAILGNCRDAGINFHLFSIIGFPEESEALARQTYQFFEDHRDLIDAPGNSFDIHPFGLELRTRYAAQSEQLGIVMNADATAKDFVIGPGEGWINGRGLGHADVERLVTEFNDRLQKIYHRYHAGPDQLWPAFEEFAVLYADHYRGRDFPYRSSVPDSATLSRFSLRWSPAACLILEDDEVCVVKSRHGESARMLRESFELLDRSLDGPLSETIEVLCGPGPARGARRAATRASIIALVNEWLAVGVLQLVPHRDAEQARTA